MIGLQDITGLILSGGRGVRMGGADKGLQEFNGMPLAQCALLRLQNQRGGPLAQVAINANRNQSAYEAFRAPVWADKVADYAGPLAGFQTGLDHCETPYLVTVPCDSPLFPMDLVERLAHAMAATDAHVALACAPDADGKGQTTLRPQPVFCLMRVQLRDSLAEFTRSGGRKAGQWISMHTTTQVSFDQPTDDPRAFFNANTLAELRALERI